MTLSASSHYRLIYRSRQIAAPVADLNFTVGQIAETSVRRNKITGVSGLLIAVQGHFIQALEGNIDAVHMTYTCISLDARHSDLHIISRGPVGQRLFGEWKMCCSVGSQADKAVVAWLNGNGNFDPEALTAASAERLLTIVAAVQRVWDRDVQPAWDRFGN